MHTSLTFIINSRNILGTDQALVPCQLLSMFHHTYFTAAFLTLQRQSYGSVQVHTLACSAKMFMSWDCPDDQLSKPWDWAQLQVQPVNTSQVMQGTVCRNISNGFANSKECPAVLWPLVTPCLRVALEMDHSYQAGEPRTHFINVYKLLTIGSSPASQQVIVQPSYCWQKGIGVEECKKGLQTSPIQNFLVNENVSKWMQ